MVDLQLMAALMRALKPTTQLVVVGDANQLPPVGPGQPLRDMLELAALMSKQQPTALPLPPQQPAASSSTTPSSATAASTTASDGLSASPSSSAWLVPVVELGRVLRQAGDSAIVSAAHDIKAGRLPDMSLPVLEGGLSRFEQLMRGEVWCSALTATCPLERTGIFIRHSTASTRTLFRPCMLYCCHVKSMLACARMYACMWCRLPVVGCVLRPSGCSHQRGDM